MRVEIRLFALARERAGRDVLDLELAERATVADLRRAVAAGCPALAPLLDSSLLAIDSEYARDDEVVPAGASVALIPPVSGG